MRKAVKNRRASQSGPIECAPVIRGDGDVPAVTPAQAFQLAVLATIWKAPVRQTVVNRLAKRSEKELEKREARAQSKKLIRDSVTTGR